MQLPPVAATTVGSFPRPTWLAEPTGSEVEFRLSGEQLREAQDDATVVTLHEQEQLGLDLLTDGEQRRPQFIFHVVARLDGFDVVNRRLKAIRARTTPERLVPRVVGPVRRSAPLVLDDFQFARAHTARPLRMALPGPMTVVDTTVDEAYGDEVGLALEVAAALNEELLALQASGLDVAQLDEPAMTRYPEKVAQYGAGALDRCLEGVTIPTIVHLCYGYPGPIPREHRHTYQEILPALLETRIGGFSVEFARSGFDPSVLKQAAGRLIMYGCVDPGPVPPEPVEQVVARVRAVLPYVDSARLLLAPDCGLMTITRDLARAKAGLLVTAGQRVRSGL